MPGGRKPEPAKNSRNELNHLLWEQTGSIDNFTLLDWEPQYQNLIDAMLEVLSTGAALFIKQGSGGRSIGIAIWEGPVKHPAKWLYDQDEVDEWAAAINSRAAARKKREAEE